MCRIEIRVFFWESLFPLFCAPLWTSILVSILGAGRHYTPSGVPLASFGAPLGALLGTCWSHWVLVGRPLGLSMELWVGLLLTL